MQHCSLIGLSNVRSATMVNNSRVVKSSKRLKYQLLSIRVLIGQHPAFVTIWKENRRINKVTRLIDTVFSACHCQMRLNNSLTWNRQHSSYMTPRVQLQHQWQPSICTFKQSLIYQIKFIIIHSLYLCSLMGSIDNKKKLHRPQPWSR